ncbi:MAG TPA: hypothetical protein VL860_06190 [Planctomycetota bacterium]|nr:hypothetical protein [Planctomycetota bacterium]
MFAICPGDGEATPVRCPGGGGDGFFEAAVAGEVAGDAATAAGELPGDAAGAVAGEIPGEDVGPAFAGAPADGAETAAP